MRTFNLVMSLLFVLFAVLQYNDPDPLVWITIYLFAAFLCWKAYAGVQHRKLTILAISIYSIYAIYLLFDRNGVLSWATEHAAESLVHSMKAEKPWIEETREFGGLAILIITMVVKLRRM